MNGLEFAPEEVVISWKGAFGSQRGFSDTEVRMGFPNVHLYEGDGGGIGVSLMELGI